LQFFKLESPIPNSKASILKTEFLNVLENRWILCLVRIEIKESETIEIPEFNLDI
jgi:hypothetical protein